MKLKRRGGLLMVLFVVAGWAAARSASPLTAAERPPNFVFILVDDLGARDLGCYGSTFYETPHLDALARSGTRFTDAYSACPVCSPSRAAIMTGKHPVRVNITDWIPGEGSEKRKLQTPDDLSALPLAEITIAEALRKVGYATGYFGKWHLGGEGFLPTDQGFDVNQGGNHAGQPASYYSPYKNANLPDGPDGEYLTDRLTDEALKFIEAQREKPFFVFLSHYTVHTPIQPCRRHLAKFQKKAKALPQISPDALEGDVHVKGVQDNAAYASMIYALDENVGRVVARLDELKLSENTVIIFTSDNGGLAALLRGIGPTSNDPLRYGKGWCYEGGIRVPLVIRAPGVAKAGSVCREPVVGTDFFATLLALAGVKEGNEEDATACDGVSLVPLLRGETEKLSRAALYWHYPHYHGSGWTTGGAVRAGDWKLVEFFESGKTELFHLSDDPGERRNLAGEQPEKLQAMHDLLKNWRKTSGAKLPTPR